MTELSRRAVLAGAAATSALPLAAIPSAHAAAPQAGKQAPSYYRYKIGSYEVTALSDGSRAAKVEQVSPRNAKPEDVKALLTSLYLPTDTINLHFNPNLINTGSKLVLIDTGNAVGRDPTTGQTVNNLAAAGIDPKAIDVVIISHFHGDHIGGMRNKDGQPTYPNAEIMVPAKEWAYFMDDGEMSRAPQGRQASFKLARDTFGPIAGKVTKYEWGKEVVPGITAMDTHGHTPGHTSFLVTSGNGKLVIQGDVSSGFGPFFVPNPDWHPGGDYDPAQGSATRRKLYDMIAADKILTTCYHFIFPGVGYLEKAGNGYRMIPAAWNPVI